VLSKRKLLRLVRERVVDGWDDPRMPTLSGLRRRGFTPESLRDFCDRIGVAKAENRVEWALLEHCVRQHLNAVAPRVMGVLDPLKVVIDNYPEGESEELEAVNNPEDEAAGTRSLPFSRELWIERTDFMEEPPKKYFRLSPGAEVRLRYGYLIRCTGIEKDQAGRVTEVRCSYDPETRGGHAPDGRKVKGTIHWVSAAHALDAPVRLYDTLFTVADPEAVEDGEDFLKHLNPTSVETLDSCKLEPSLVDAEPGSRYQFERQGYFCVDTRASEPGRPVFNRIVTLRDTWGKIQAKG
jgi:glutaminyl-tRNA synthetase